MMDRKNKILIATGIYEPDIGGPASYAKILGIELAKKNDVAILTYSWRFKFDKDAGAPYRIIRVWRKIPKILRHLIYYFKARKWGKKSDLILALNAISAGIPAMWVARSLKKKFVVKIVGDYAWEKAINTGKTYLLLNDFQKSKKKGWIGILHKLQVRVCRQAHTIIVPSEYLADIVSGWGIDRPKIKVIYNGTDFKTLDMTREEARKKIGIAGNLIVSAGRLVPWKGYKMLIKIMPKVLEIGQFFRLVIVGDGPDKKILETMVRNMNLERKVFIVGMKSKEELALYFAAADMFVLNTGYEGFSHQILEAMAAGVPVITTNVGGNREVIGQGENGFMVKYNDEFNLVEAIKTLHNMPELKEKFIEEGKKTVKYYSLDKMYLNTINLVEEVLLPNRFLDLK
jgi:glycosyltransferase involved in cell wall biosynthesis